ncbi:LOW QUALITY PROTEIN: protein mono-ADP-ribosyltransferase PARP3, partial [Thomomys bottae]
CTLNQTNIKCNNNKFHIIQLWKGCWRRSSHSKLSHCACLEDAKKDFEKKFRRKTKNNWADESILSHPGKLQADQVQEAVVKVDIGPEKSLIMSKPCSRDPSIKLINIFSKDMFKNAMAQIIYVKKMPGKLSKQQMIAKGFEAEALEMALKSPPDSNRDLDKLSSQAKMGSLENLFLLVQTLPAT